MIGRYVAAVRTILRRDPYRCPCGDEGEPMRCVRVGPANAAERRGGFVVAAILTCPRCGFSFRKLVER